MNYLPLDHRELFLIAIICLLVVVLPIGRWLYVRSMRIRSRIQMNYLFTNIAHELLTPLSILRASVEHLRETSPEEKQEYDLMELNIERTVHLLQMILETSKSQQGGLKLLVSHGDVMRYITETARCIVPLMKQKNLEFTITCKPESMMGWIDSDKLDKIITNLLSNAAKYTKENGKVTLDVATNKHYDRVTIRVSDNGIGISKEQMKRLFSRFHDGEYRSSQTFGTGLGLALTRDLVYLHRGNIKCRSYEGQGTTFIVDLPIVKEAFTPSQIDEQNKLQLKATGHNILDLPAEKQVIPIDIQQEELADEDAYRILIVEDNAELKMLMSQLLRKKYHVLSASNGKEALDMIQKNEFDIIVSDVMMPEMDGYELTRQLKEDERYSHLPIILLTAKTQHEDRETALSIGADDFITKPFRMSELQLRIDNIIANRQRIRSIIAANEGLEGHVTPNSPDEEFLQRALKCLHEHLTDSDYDRDSFASDMGASASTLYNKLRSLTGMNVTAFIRNTRIKTACRLAREYPDLRVSDIAYRVGFKDPKYFATSFKKEMGIQPKEYFDQIRNEMFKGKSLSSDDSQSATN